MCQVSLSFKSSKGNFFAVDVLAYACNLCLSRGYFSACPQKGTEGSFIQLLQPYSCTSSRARSRVRKSPGFTEVITCQLCQPFSSRPGIQQKSAQGVGQKDKLLELLKFQPFAPGRRSLKDLQMPENPGANAFSPAFSKVWHDRKLGPGPTVAATAKMSTPAALQPQPHHRAWDGACTHSASGGAARLASHLSWMLCQNLHE